SGARQYVGEDAAWFRSYFAVPILPKYDDQNTDAAPYQLGNAQLLGYRGSQNPFFPLLYNDNRNNVGKVLGNFFLDFDILPDNLSFKTQLNYTYENINSRRVDFPYSDGQTEFLSGISRSSTTILNTIWDNYLTYENNWGAHGITAVVGYSFRNETFENLFARGEDLSVPLNRDREELWYLRFGQTINADATGDGGAKLYGSSIFGRLAYNYDDRYLLYATLRREGTNRIQDTWDIFPTIGAGWVASEEGFFNVDFIDWLKFRASWGRLGNDGISPALGAPERNPVFFAVNDQRIQGTQVVPVFDLIDSWEFTEEINVGMSARMLNNRLSIEADYYVRDTEDAVITVNLPLIRNNVRRNLGQIRNQGLEMAVNWNDQVGSDFTYSFGFNFATLKNEVLSLGGQEYIDHGQAEFRQRSIIGQTFEAFFGYETMGVFQTEEEVNNSGLTSEFIADNNLVPGDFIYKDQNGDGVIDDQDRVVLGSYLPDITYGANISLNYRSFGFSATFQGQAGHDILNRKRGEIIFTTDTNIDAELANNLWRGEGTSNKYPSAAGLRKGYNQIMSDYYVEDGSYFRIQNVQLSYKLSNKQVLGATLPETTFLLTAERPLTVFNYNGFNPEVPNGIDRQTYPIPAIYTVGLNVTF
ncbi:MAG: SusC/RagA family TonB-linked outer membrane protein, partial [Cyclobacteriaceae bacterium]